MKSQEIKIELIVVTDNPRTVCEQEPLEDLAQSIKDKGILQPLILKALTKGKYELISGSRRLEAAKNVGLKTVPATIIDPSNKHQVAEIRLEENIHREDLSPVEEGLAFQDYITKTKTSPESLAKKISKPLLYVERRLKIAEQDDAVQKAVKEKKITMGHALALARITDKKEQMSLLKNIQQEGMSVKETLDRIQYGGSTKQLSDAQFDKGKGSNGLDQGDTGCKGCPFNGGEQTLLFDTGSELKGYCLKEKCFTRKTEEWLENEKQRLTEQGVQVLTPKEVTSRKNLQQIHSWDQDMNKIRKDMKKHPDDYVVVYNNTWRNDFEQEIYKIKKPGKGKKDASDEEAKEREKRAREKLKDKVEAFKRDFLIQNNSRLMKPDSKEAKTLTLLSLLLSRFQGEDAGKMLAETGIRLESCFYYESSRKRLYKELYGLKENVLDKLIARASCWRFPELPQHDILDCAAALKTDMSRDFIITEKFLDLHTKDQLLDLAKEIGLDKNMKEKDEKWSNRNRSGLIDAFLKEGFDLKGIVPKSMTLPVKKSKS